MKFNLLSLAILSVVALTACGGGSSSSSSNNTSTENGGSSNENGGSTSTNGGATASAEWFEFDLAHYSSKPTNSLVDQISKYTIKDKTLFYDVVYNSPQSIFTSTIGLANYVTADGLYLANDAKEDLGYKFGKLSSYTPTSWVYTPENTENKTAFKLTENFKQIDLSGKSIGLYLSPYEYFAGKDPILMEYTNSQTLSYFFSQKIQEKTFPKGATCLISTSASSNLEHIRYEKDWIIEDKNLNQYADYIPKTIGNFSASIEPDAEEFNYFGANSTVKIGSTYYFGDYYSKGQKYALDLQKKSYQSDYNDDVEEFGVNSPQALMSKYYLQALDTECTFFNKVASDAIQEALK